MKKVRQALDILALGDGRLYEADRFLATVRLSPSVWPVLHALIHSPPSQLHLTFAARTLHMRMRTEFLAFDERSRADAFSLAVDGALRSATLLQGSHSPVHYFSCAVGYVVGQASPPMREEMWRALHDKFTDPILRCNVLAAVVQETNDSSVFDVARRAETKQFWRKKAGEVLPVAMSLLHPPGVTSESYTLRLRAGIACLHTWWRYGKKYDAAMALLPVLSSAGLAGAVGETLAEIVSYSGTSLDLLGSVCDGLALTFRNNAAVSPNEIHHAIAEVCCAMSEGNADDVVRRGEETRIVAQKVTELLWLCLKSPDDKAFCAALNGWSPWITAETFAKQWQRKLGKTQVALLVDTVVQRMSMLQFVKAIVHPEESDMVESSYEKGFVTSFLLQASACLGTAEYVRVVCPLLTTPRTQNAYSVCAALTALAAAGESMTTFESSSEDGEIIHVMLDAVLSLLESCHSIRNNVGSSHAIRACGLHLLSCYEAGLHESSDATLLRAIRCAGTGILDTSVNEEAAQLLLDLAEMNGTRIVSFLPDLLASCKQVLPRMPIKAAEKCVKALGTLTLGLNEHDRCKAMGELLSDLCHGVRWAIREKRVHEHEDDICRSLTLICSAIEDLRYDGNCKRIFGSMQDDIFAMAGEHCTRAELSKCVCRFLQVFAVPVLMGYGEEEEEDGDAQRAAYMEERTQLAMRCAEVASETFVRSGSGAEAEWLGVLGEALDAVVSAADKGVHAAQTCLTVSFTRGTQGLSKLCQSGYDTRPDVTIGYLRISNHLIGGSGNSLLPFVEGMTGVAMGCMKSTNASIVKEALLYFRKGFGYGQTGRMGEAVVAAGGGAGCVAAGILSGTQMRKCCRYVADVLYALVRVVSGGCDAGVMVELLKEGFRRNDVPLQGLDAAERERLLAGCCKAVESNRMMLLRALCEIARTCQRTLV